MRSLHAYTPVSGSFTSEPLNQSVQKKGRSSRALQFTNKLTSEELKFKFYENECNLFDAIRRVRRGYEILRS